MEYFIRIKNVLLLKPFSRETKIIAIYFITKKFIKCLLKFQLTIRWGYFSNIKWFLRWKFYNSLSERRDFQKKCVFLTLFIYVIIKHAPILNVSSIYLAVSNYRLILQGENLFRSIFYLYASFILASNRFFRQIYIFFFYCCCYFYHISR